MDLETNLVWNPRAVSRVRKPQRGALQGTLLGVQVDGHTIGYGTAYQLVRSNGDVRTVFWIGSVDSGNRPLLFDVDTHERVSAHEIVEFYRLTASPK